MKVFITRKIPDVGTNSTADMTTWSLWSLFLAFIRHVPFWMTGFVRKGKWGAWNPDLCMMKQLPWKEFLASVDYFSLHQVSLDINPSIATNLR